MILPVAIDVQGGPSVLVGIVKEFDSRLEHKCDESVRGRLAFGVIQRQGRAEHMLDQVCLFIFLESPAPMVPREGIPAPDRCKGEYRLGRDQPFRVFCDQGFKFAQEQQGQLDRDTAG
jgi:hypothetical protein